MADYTWEQAQIGYSGVPDEVKRALDSISQLSTNVDGVIDLLQVGLDVTKLLIPLYADPAAAAVDLALKTVEDAVSGLSAGRIKMIVLTDPPDLGTLIVQAGAKYASTGYNHAAKLVEQESFAKTAAGYFGTAYALPGVGIEVAKKYADIATTLTTAARGPGPIQSIKTRLLDSVVDSGDQNAPGSLGETAGLALSLVATGDGAASLANLIQLIVSLPTIFESPAGQPSLPTPKNPKVVNLRASRIDNLPLITWEQGYPEPNKYPVTYDGTAYGIPAVYVERSWDRATWVQVASIRLSDEYDVLRAYKGSLKGHSAALDETFAADLATARNSGTVTHAFYRVRYGYTDTVSTFSPVASYLIGSTATTTSAPPDWIATPTVTLPGSSALQLEISRLRKDLADSVNPLQNTLKEYAAYADKKLAQTRRANAQIRQICDAIASVAAVPGGTVYARWADLSGATDVAEQFNGHTSAVSFINAGQAAAAAQQGTLTSKLYNDYAASLAQIPEPTGDFKAAVGVFFVADSPALEVALRGLASIIGLSAVIAQGVTALDANNIRDIGLRIEGALSPFADLPPSVTTNPPDPSVSLGESDSPLNINPAPGTYEKPLLGETDYPGADLNCPT